MHTDSSQWVMHCRKDAAKRETYQGSQKPASAGKPLHSNTCVQDVRDVTVNGRLLVEMLSHANRSGRYVADSCFAQCHSFAASTVAT